MFKNYSKSLAISHQKKANSSISNFKTRTCVFILLEYTSCENCFKLGNKKQDQWENRKNRKYEIEM